MGWKAHLSIRAHGTITEGASTLFYAAYIRRGPYCPKIMVDYMLLLDMWRMSCCQCADRGNDTSLYILLCPNASHRAGAPRCPFRRSDPRSLQQVCLVNVGP